MKKLIIILKEKGSFTISNLNEKENPSVEISTLMEMITSMQENFKQQIEELKQENTRLNKRLDNAAKCVKSLQCEIESLKQNNPSTENNTSTEEKPSTEANGIPSSKTSMEEQTNNPTLASVHTEENPTDEFDLETELALDSIFGKEDKSTEDQITSTEKTDNNPTEERTIFQVEGTNQNENNSSTNEIFDLSPSNDITLTVANTDREDALETKGMPLNAISEQSIDNDKETNNTSTENNPSTEEKPSTEDENDPNARYFKFGNVVIKECCVLNHSKCMSDLYDREKELKDHYQKLFKDGKIDDVEFKIASLAINDAKEKVEVKILNSAYCITV